jgi:hypothetical protein
MTPAHAPPGGVPIEKGVITVFADATKRVSGGQVPPWGFYFRASGEGDVAGQAPGVMYSK